ncbi:hypothetical protein CapIbe_013734 [Capra ibex]
MTSWRRVLIYRRLAAISVFRGCELAVPVSCSLLLRTAAGMTPMWILMASVGQLCTRRMTTTAGVLKRKLGAVSMSRQPLSSLDWKLKSSWADFLMMATCFVTWLTSLGCEERCFVLKISRAFMIRVRYNSQPDGCTWDRRANNC